MALVRRVLLGWWQSLALDLRSLALMRISLGCLLLLDLAIRAGDLEAHYSDWGTQPSFRVLEWAWQPGFWSLHFIHGHWLAQVALFLLQALAYGSLILGYRTRLAGWTSWVLLVSLHSRNPMILDGGDLYLRCLLFWLNFCPWGLRWSLDQRLRPQAYSPRITNLATLAYLWQLSLIYGYAFSLKDSSPWRIEGTAVEYALKIDQIASPPAQWLLQHSSWLPKLNFAVLYFEGAIPILFWLHPLTRGLAIVGLTVLHLSLGTFFHLGVFAPVAATCAWGLIPSQFWSFLGTRDPQPSQAVTLSKPSQILILFLLARVSYANGAGWHWAQQAPDLALLRLDQRWDMFAPKPLTEDGYFVIVGETVAGELCNLWLRGPLQPDWCKPAAPAQQYPNARWRKLMMNLSLPAHKPWRRPLLAYLARRWGQEHPGQWLRSARLYFVREVTQPDLSQGPLEVVLLDYLCGQSILEGQTMTVYSSLESADEVLQKLRKI